MADGFKDHFSMQAAAYGRFRPSYPDARFDFLAGLAPGRHLAHDVATGSGQCAVSLAELQRVLRPDGAIAIWCYGPMRVGPAVDWAVQRLYDDSLGSAYWPAERRLVEAGYAGLAFPFERLPAPAFSMTRDGSLAQLMGYLGAWSAVAAFRQRNGTDPLALVAEDIGAAWGGVEARRVEWPLALLVGRRRG